MWWHWSGVYYHGFHQFARFQIERVQLFHQIMDGSDNLRPVCDSDNVVRASLKFDGYL